MKLWQRLALGASAPIVIVAGYAMVTATNPSPFFPPLPVILERFSDLWLFSRFFSDVVPSMRNFAVGALLAVILGVPLGVLLGRVRWLGGLALFLLDFARSVPPIMLIPPFVLVLGVGDAAKILIIFLGTLFPVVIATLDGLRRTDPALLDVARVIHLGRMATITRIYLPSASPAIFGGIQTGLQFALLLMVASEMVAAVRGVGYVTMQGQATFNAPTVWAGILLLALIGYLINALFVAVRNRALAWNRGFQASLQSR